jgi:integrase
VRWITPQQVTKLLAELPQHQKDETVFALCTGLRQANVIGLTWDQVNLDRNTAWIPGELAKGKEDIHISPSDLAVEILRAQVGKHQKMAFYLRRKANRSDKYQVVEERSNKGQNRKLSLALLSCIQN